MKIGILTLPLYTNYGGILQAYALQKVLEEMGHDAIHLNGKKKQILFSRRKLILIYTKRILLRYVLRKKEIELFIEKKVYERDKQFSIYTNEFIDRYLNVVDIPISRLPKNFVDAIIVGSDQIWRPYYNENIGNAFLEFAKNWSIKRISYAPSFGKDTWEFSLKDTLKCRKLISRFDAVSIREVSGVKLCREYLNIDAKFVLDPTMLLTTSDYIALLNKNSTDRDKGDLMVYILDYTDDKEKVIEKIQLHCGYKTIFKAGSKIEDATAEFIERIQPPVEDWIQGFCDAKFVITDSFHACVFSILFNKPFIVYGNNFRGNGRFMSLLSTFGLEDRLISSSIEIEKVLISEIDWDRVNTKLVELRKMSMLFIKDSVE